jgi:hypothetical protein
VSRVPSPAPRIGYTWPRSTTGRSVTRSRWHRRAKQPLRTRRAIAITVRLTGRSFAARPGKRTRATARSRLIAATGRTHIAPSSGDVLWARWGGELARECLR